MIPKMFEGLNAAIMASDADFKIIYQNEKCRQLFKQVFGTADYIGKSIHECHNEKTTEKVKTYFLEYIEKKRNLDYYVTEINDEKITVVNVPYYDGQGAFSGVVEFVFQSSLA
jgi:hypothetical protein